MSTSGYFKHNPKRQEHNIWKDEAIVQNLHMIFVICLWWCIFKFLEDTMDTLALVITKAIGANNSICRGPAAAVGLRGGCPSKS